MAVDENVARHFELSFHEALGAWVKFHVYAVGTKISVPSNTEIATPADLRKMPATTILRETSNHLEAIDMSQHDFARRLEALGVRRSEASRWLGIHPSSALRYARGDLEIPSYVLRGLENVERLLEAGITPAGAATARPVGRPPIARLDEPGTAQAKAQPRPDIAGGMTVDELKSAIVEAQAKIHTLSEQLRGLMPALLRIAEERQAATTGQPQLDPKEINEREIASDQP